MGWVCWWSWTPPFPPWWPTSLGCPVHTSPTSFMCYSVSNYTYMRIQHAYYTIEYKSWHNHPPLSIFHLGLFLEIYWSLLLGGLTLNFGGLTWVLGVNLGICWSHHERDGLEMFDPIISNSFPVRYYGISGTHLPVIPWYTRKPANVWDAKYF